MILLYHSHIIVVIYMSFFLLNWCFYCSSLVVEIWRRMPGVAEADNSIAEPDVRRCSKVSAQEKLGRDSFDEGRE